MSVIWQLPMTGPSYASIAQSGRQTGSPSTSQGSISFRAYRASTTAPERNVETSFHDSGLKKTWSASITPSSGDPTGEESVLYSVYVGHPEIAKRQAWCCGLFAVEQGSRLKPIWSERSTAHGPKGDLKHYANQKTLGK